MGEYCVVVADGAHARFLSLESAGLPSMESGPNLVERDRLVNAEAEMQGRELWTDPKSGRNTTSSSGMTHGYDDHRDRHMDEFLRRFANKITASAVRFTQEQHAKKLVLVAEKRMLGFLRHELAIPPHTDIEVKDLAKDLTKLNLSDLHSHLGKEGLIPVRKGPAA